MAPIPTPSEPEDDPGAYVGLDPQTAEERARAQGWSTVRKLPPGAIITMEYRSSRLNLEVDGGAVTRSWKG
jgi:hypothetical protein